MAFSISALVGGKVVHHLMGVATNFQGGTF